MGKNFKTSVLSYARSIDTSTTFFSAYNSNNSADLQPIVITEKGVLGQISNAIPDAKLKEQNMGGSNPQCVDVAVVPYDCDRMLATFQISVVNNSVEPHATNDAEVTESFEGYVEQYAEVGGFEYLASLYLFNVFNGSWMWRNRQYAADAKVKLQLLNGASITVNALELPPVLDSSYETKEHVISAIENVIVECSDGFSLSELISRFADSLAGKERVLKMNVSWDGDVIAGQEVYPSEDFLRESRREKDKSKSLAGMMYKGQKIAGLTPQKVGAAIRKIDIWNASNIVVPINPYSGDKATQSALRNSQTKDHLYELIKNPDSHVDRLMSAKDVSDLDGVNHFFVANLIRGGVFGVK